MLVSLFLSISFSLARDDGSWRERAPRDLEARPGRRCCEVRELLDESFLFLPKRTNKCIQTTLCQSEPPRPPVHPPFLQPLFLPYVRIARGEICFKLLRGASRCSRPRAREEAATFASFVRRSPRHALRDLFFLFFFFSTPHTHHLVPLSPSHQAPHPKHTQLAPGQA